MIRYGAQMARTRNSVVHLLERAFRKPQLVVPYVRRRLRNRRIRANATSHPEFYRGVMADDVSRRSAKGAVGTASDERWLAYGQLQYRYLIDNGLERHYQMLEIGCGNLRAGWRFIEFLDAGHYTGIDISPEILLAAQETVVERELQQKRPVMMLAHGIGLDALPADWFDVAHAHSVFSHTPLSVIEGYLAGLRRVLKPSGFFDFTYNSTEGEEWNFLEEDYYFSLDALTRAAARHGFDLTPMTGWKHKQDKVRLRPQSWQVAGN